MEILKKSYSGTNLLIRYNRIPLRRQCVKVMGRLNLLYAGT